jgi:hypothetical protein
MLLMIANAMGVLAVIFNNFIDIEKTNMHTWIYNKHSQGDITFVKSSMLSPVMCLNVGVPRCDTRCDFHIKAMFV